MTDGLRFPQLCVPAVSRQPPLILRPWRAADIPALAAEMSREYLTAGMWSRPDERPVRTGRPGGSERRTGPTDECEAARWLASQNRGWRDGDRLSFAVLEANEVGGCVLAGNVGLKNREETGRIGERETAEIGYWTAEAARGRGIAPAAVRAVTDLPLGSGVGRSRSSCLTEIPAIILAGTLSEIVDRLEREHGRVVITKHGHPAAVVISPDHLESLGKRP